MFSREQKESFQQISAPDGLKERILSTCESSKSTTVFFTKKVFFTLAPVAACFILCLSLFIINKREHTPLSLFVNEQLVSSEALLLHPKHETANSMVRTISLSPEPYTLKLSANQDFTILSCDGSFQCTDETHILWNVTIPTEDTVYSMNIQSGKATYLIHLSYQAQDGTFHIYYETNS